jgi:hypothetical protein
MYLYRRRRSVCTPACALPTLADPFTALVKATAESRKAFTRSVNAVSESENAFTL